jgi:hypothetical protein
MDDVHVEHKRAAEDRSAAEVSAIGRKARRGLRWALSGTVAVKLGSFLMGLVLVRLIVPQDFGLYGVALATNAFAIHVNDMGIIAATVQWRGRVEEMAPTAATIALGFSLAWYGLFWVAAPEFAQLAGSPEATPIVRLLTATILIDGITAVHVGVLQRAFQQDKLTSAIMVGFLFNAATAIALATNGAGAYSLVIGALAQSVVTGVIVLRQARLPFRYGFDRTLAKRLLKFGVPLAVIALQRGGVNLRPVVRALPRPLLGGLLAALTMLGLSELLTSPPPVELFVAGGAGLLAYLLVVIRPGQFRQLMAKITSASA